ncbi:MAG: ATP-binding protein [Hyphomicrobiaceae bacterium]
MAILTAAGALALVSGPMIGNRMRDVPVRNTGLPSPAAGAGRRSEPVPASPQSGAAINPDASQFAADNASDKSSAVAMPEPGWRSVIDALSDPTLVLDNEDIVAHYNPSCADFFAQIRLGAPISHVTRSPDLLSGIRDARSGRDRTIVELQDRVPIDRRLSAIITRLPVSDVEPPPDLLIVFRDITDQERVAQLRADFIAYASHELRTPLSSLRGFVETLQGPARNDEAARERFLTMMASQATRMTRLIDDLLSLSRAEMRVHVAPRGTIDLIEVLEHVIETLEASAEASEISLEFRPLQPPVKVRGERDELVQVFVNLVQNAIKYGRPGGRVEVRMRRGSALEKWRGRVQVDVIDDGPGIAEEHLPRLTERFYRVNVARSRETGGTGLGLAIVKHIVARHRGELRISSNVGEGSTFTVELQEVRENIDPKFM